MAYLRKAVTLLSSSHVFVVFDSETGIEHKVEQTESYKANRDYSDTGMYIQLPLIQRILDYLNIKYLEPANQEADDYIGSLAKYVCDHVFEATVFSNDADFLQLISNNIKVLKVGRKSLEIVNQQIFQKLYGFKTSLYIDYLSLKGDNSDNIRGVPGIGPKTAQKFVSDFGTIENIFINIDKVPGKMHKSLLDYRDLIKNNLQLIKISTEVLESGLNLLDYKINDSSELNKSTNYLLDKIGIDTK
ncbi:MAG: DNA polymerase I [uncultured bacterium]|nr:MAG: DNA polymerase I [uncultured bacterium]